MPETVVRIANSSSTRFVSQPRSVPTSRKKSTQKITQATSFAIMIATWNQNPRRFDQASANAVRSVASATVIRPPPPAAARRR